MSERVGKQETTVAITRYLVIVNVFVWLILATVTAAGLHPALPDSELVRWGMSGLSFLTCASIAVLYYLATRHVQIAYYLLLLDLAVISFFTITDEFGIADLFVLLINIATILLLIRDRAFYVSRNGHSSATT